MKTLADRFRNWYEYERDCNAKVMGMLESVPEDRRNTPQFQRAVGRMAHLVAARRRWLFRLGQGPGSMAIFPQVSLGELPALIAEIESAWVTYLSKLTDDDLAREFEYITDEGKRLRWHVEALLTQTFIHAPYHRGQIAQLVAELGGKAVDTDFLFFQKPTPLG